MWIEVAVMGLVIVFYGLGLVTGYYLHAHRQRVLAKSVSVDWLPRVDLLPKPSLPPLPPLSVATPYAPKAKQAVLEVKPKRRLLHWPPTAYAEVVKSSSQPRAVPGARTEPELAPPPAAALKRGLNGDWGRK